MPAEARNFFQTARKIVCVGRNYVAHAKELGNEVPKEPVLFLKPPSAFLENGGKILVPQDAEVHHEVELAIIIGKSGRKISPDAAMDYVAGYAVALDLTSRNIQTEAKAKGLPWTVAKGTSRYSSCRCTKRSS